LFRFFLRSSVEVQTGRSSEPSRHWTLVRGSQENRFALPAISFGHARLSDAKAPSGIR
jgi:hypothetical protein